ncbi:MAG: hypothetical protein GC204_16690 [Chloroflexi bacterium]|nr:hypothetical protein [Chloroflexota bacterium]
MLSRRHFLQLAGIAVTAQALPNLATSPVAPAFETSYGRALATTPVYAAPSLDAPLLRQIWSDTISPIFAAEGEWYRLPKGFALREHMQPLNAAAQYSEAAVAPPFWAEVSGSIAVIRSSCAVDAPAVTRIGHGGVLHVVDYLPGWYGVSDTENGALLGWSLTELWSPVQLDTALPALSLVVDSSAQQMSVYENQRRLLSAPISTGYDLAPGIYPITERNLSRADQQMGAPYALTFGDRQQIIGVYWHNQFGRAVPGAAVQMTPALARWLYLRVAEVIVS